VPFTTLTGGEAVSSPIDAAARSDVEAVLVAWPPHAETAVKVTARNRPLVGGRRIANHAL
jgi:hypothetical protein